MTVFNMHDAKTQLSKLVDAAERGETVVIARNGKPAVQLTAVGGAGRQWSPEALSFFTSPPAPELADFEIPGDDLRPLPERDLF
ncbi:type II toxin-antitoxin system Phd/YefM family antitoxin [Deinococcus arcticus]|uniref:Antitoxin n=1 Tax=Deinococcus arcticus TaxID=2136176 RepID=A0A2T3W9B5_9DEIO|nr:type II toxin-antitoxin system prevent-host-death family antitoxin [Deinococcus arcticus]PTA68500.1 type II toxin-antitoxin system prevent-host-death family antitoxin [Deinococcus arcticus]